MSAELWSSGSLRRGPQQQQDAAAAAVTLVVAAKPRHVTSVKKRLGLREVVLLPLPLPLSLYLHSACPGRCAEVRTSRRVDH